MKKFLMFILIAILTGLPLNSYGLDETLEQLKLYLGEVKVLSVTNPTRIAIGNPNIVDVTDVTKSEITLSPKTVGSTNLVFWDNFGEQSYRVKVLTEDMSEIKQRIDNLLAKLNLPEVSAQAEETEGKILLLGRVKTTQDRERIALALGALKEKTIDLIEVKEEEAIVEIDVQVLELSRDATDTLGLTWPGSVTISTDQAVSSTSTYTGTTPARWETFFKITNWSRLPFEFKLEALIQQGKARILSRPRLACQSGKEAELLVGGEKPIFTTEVASAGGQGTEVEYKEYGIKLKIKPTVMPEKQVKLALSVDVSEVGAAETIGSTTAPTAKAYPLTKRTASTELFLSDGQTMAIGGLIKQKSEEDIRKTPILGDVPILGLIFRKKVARIGGGQGERGETELFITLTPTTIRPEEREGLKKETSARLEPSAPVSIAKERLPAFIASYASAVEKRILENLVYPAQAKLAGFQGRVLLSLHLSYRGELLETKLKTSSGHKLLDEHALTVATGIDLYPPFPSSIEQKELWIDIPIVYRLD